jgi:hypothetical protein
LLCFSRYRNRSQRRIIVNGSTTTPLLGTMEVGDLHFIKVQLFCLQFQSHFQKGPMESNLKALESRIDNIRAQLDTRAGLLLQKQQLHIYLFLSH